MLTAGIFGTGPIYIGKATTDCGQIFINGAGVINNPITYNSVLGTDIIGATRIDSTPTFNGVQTAGLTGITWGSNSTGVLTVTGKVTGTGTFTGTITGGFATTGAGQVITTNAGVIVGSTTSGTSITVILNNPNSNNDYTGDTWITNKGILQTDAVNQLPSGVGTGDVYLNGTFNMQGFSQAIGGLSGSGTLDSVSGTTTLDIGGNNSTGLTFTGVIKNTAGTLSLVKSGTGTQTINSATANTFSGSITANAGTLVMAGTNSFTGAVNANSGGFVAFASSAATGGALGNSTVVNLNGGGISYTASGTNALNRPIAIGAGDGTVNVQSPTGTLTSIAGSVSSTGGNLVKTGSGVFSIAGSTTLLNSGAAGVVVNGGTLQGGFGTAGIGSINVGAGGNLSFVNNIAENLNLITGGGSGTLTLTSGAQLSFELGASSGTNDAITYNTATGSGNVTLNFSPLAGFAGSSSSSYTLITSSNTGGLSGLNFQLGSAPTGFNYTISNDGTIVTLNTVPYTPIYWSGGTDSSWATAANFTDQPGTTLAGHTPANNETVIFNAANAVGPTISTTLDGSPIIDSLQFTGGGTPTVTSVTIAQGTGSGTLTLKPASASGGIAILTGGGNATIAAPLALDNTLSASQTWSVVDAGSTLIISGNVTFGANVTKTGAGTLQLSGSNSGSGNLTLSAGTLELNSAGALGSGTLTIASSTTLNNTLGSAVILTGNGAVNINGDFTFTGSNDLAFGSGAVTLANNPTITTTTTAKVLTLGGNVSGTGFTKMGAGTLVLNGSTNTYSGLTTVNGGVLTLNAANTTGGGVTVTTGTLNIGSLSAVSGLLTIAAGTIDNTTGTAGTLSGVTGTAINGSFTFTGTNSLNLGTGAVTLGATSTITTTGAATTLTIGGAIGATASGITKAGPGTLTLTNTNSYNGATSVTAGTLSLTGSLTGSTAIATSGTGVFSQSSTGVMSGLNTAFTQGSSGTSVLAGTNTYKGVTTVSAGTLNITGSLNNAALGNIALTGGILNISGAGSVTGSATATKITIAPTSGNAVVNYTSSGTSTLFAITGASVTGTSSAYYQTNGNVVMTPGVTTGTQSVVGSGNGAAAGGSGTYGFYSITGGTLKDSNRFTLTGQGTASATNGTNAGVMAGVVYVGGTGAIDQTNAEWYLSYSLGQTTVMDSGKIDRTGSVTGTPYGIIMNTATGVTGGAYGVLNLAGTGAQVLLGAGGMKYGNATTVGQGDGLNAFVNLGAGTLSTGVVAAVSLPVAPTATNYGYWNYAGGTVKATAALASGWTPATAATITFTHTVFGPINNNAGALTGSGAPSFNGGLTVDTNGFAVTVPSTTVFAGASGVGVTQANLSVSGGSGYIGAPAVYFSKPAATTGVPAAGYALMSGGSVLGIVITDPGTYAASETPTVTLIGGGASVAATVTSTALATTNANTGGLTKIGVGTLSLSGISTFGGVVTISGGTLQANGASTLANIGTNSAIGKGDATSTATNAASLVLDGGTFSIINTGAVVSTTRLFTVTQNGGTLSFDNGTAANVITFNNALAIAYTGSGARTLTFTGVNAATNILYNSFAPLIGNAGSDQVSVTKTGVTAVALTNAGNTYNGPTTISGGILAVPSLGGTVGAGLAASYLGSSSNAAANLVLSGGTLLYTGGGETSDRNYTFGNATTAAGGGFDTTGATGPLVLSGNMTGANAASGTQVLTLTSLAASGANALNGLIVDSSATALTGVTKAGVGAWTFAGTNTYFGPTTISAGTLVVANLQNGGVNSNIGKSSSAASNLVFGTGTTLRYTGGTVTIDRNFTMNATGTATFDVTQASTTLELPGATGAVTTGSLVKTGLGAMTLSGANTYNGDTVVSAGTLNITGSLNGLAASTNLAYGNTAGNTIINITGSGSINNYKNFTGANVAGSIAVMNQTGATSSTSTLGSGGLDTQWVAQNGGYGYLNITGGTFNTGRFDAVGATGGGTAVIYVGGTGIFNNNSSDWLILPRTNGTGQLTVGPGGNLVRTAAVTAQLGITMNGTNSTGVLNVAGGTVDTGVRAIQFGFGTPGAGNRGFLNVAGGTLSVGLAIAQAGTAGSTAEYYNFAGGTVKMNAALAAWIPATPITGHTSTSTIYGSVTNNNNANSTFNTQIGTTSNFTGGLTVDTNGFATTFTNVFRGASGVGVTQANIGDVSLMSGNSGYIGAPSVVFSAPAAAGAVPASGYAVIDTVTGKVNGIVITNPGTYAANETPTITLTGGGGTIAAITTTALTTANVSGGLTKIGTGTLTLSGTNLYSGPTTISAGTLKAGVASVSNVSGAFGNNSAVTMANVSGATLDITGFNTQIGSITGGGATGGNVLLGAATLTIGGDNTSPAAYAGVISSTGAGAITKIGSGTTYLSGGNTYTGPTQVNAGTLSVGVASVGSLGSTAVTVGGGTATGTPTLGGTGTIGGLVTISSANGGAVGTIAPGNSVGTITLNGGLNLQAGAKWAIEIASSANPGTPGSGGSTIGTLPNPTSNDFINITSGGATISSGTVFAIDGGGQTFSASSNYSYQIAQGAGDQSALNINSLATPGQFTFSNVSNSGELSLSVTGDSSGRIYLNVTPEPGTILGLAAAGMGLAGWIRRRKFKSHQAPRGA